MYIFLFYKFYIINFHNLFLFIIKKAPFISNLKTFYKDLMRIAIALIHLNLFLQIFCFLEFLKQLK